MQQSLGEVVRQIRRLRNLTQRELAGERYSKSYVSAVEHNRIAPSAEALRFFAERLGEPDGNFTALLGQPDIEKALSVLDRPLPVTNGYIKRDATIALLHTLLEQAEFPGLAPHHLPALAQDALASLPPHLQSRYYFLMGQSAREKRDLPTALRAFEAALALAPADQQAAILDEIGSCYFQQRAYHTALGYHLHALRLLLKAPFSRASLPLTVELHCGEDYQALGAYRQALEHYESARTYLSTQHDLATAGKLYTALGYCTYAALSQATAPSLLPVSEQLEHDYQRASSFLHQGVSFSQVSGDRLGETNARLTLTSLLLDWGVWLRRTEHGRAGKSEKHPSWTPCATLLEDAAEQCRQVLLAWQGADQGDEAPPAELAPLLYMALAYLVRIAVQRAILAHLEGSYIDAAYRERAFAAHLCRLVLDSLSTHSLPWAAVQQALTLSAERLAYRSPSLPRLTDLPDMLTERSDPSPRSPLALVEVYVAAGEVAEELGRVATAPAYAHDCYMQASQYLQAALSLADSLHVKGARDPGSLARLYQRYIALLEERASNAPAFFEETTKALLGVLQQGFWLLQHVRPEDETLHAQRDGEAG